MVSIRRGASNAKNCPHSTGFVQCGELCAGSKPAHLSRIWTIQYARCSSLHRCRFWNKSPFFGTSCRWFFGPEGWRILFGKASYGKQPIYGWYFWFLWPQDGQGTPGFYHRSRRKCRYWRTKYWLVRQRPQLGLFRENEKSRNHLVVDSAFERIWGRRLQAPCRSG